ncbi:hypothetical protein [Parvibaculum sp.]|uniref:hypothetical protein n=1 Tax=Parvibaculum sp. TaxID=2024848 RepID=UPI0025D8530A|nr:hypothetical protein [Parvibaculum sp.]
MRNNAAADSERDIQSKRTSDESPTQVGHAETTRPAVTDVSSNGERYMSANGVLQRIGPANPDEWEAIEGRIQNDYERCHPGDSLRDLRRRARFSKEDKGRLRDWMKIGATRQAGNSK